MNLPILNSEHMNNKESSLAVLIVKAAAITRKSATSLIFNKYSQFRDSEKKPIPNVPV